MFSYLNKSKMHCKDFFGSKLLYIATVNGQQQSRAVPSQPVILQPRRPRALSAKQAAPSTPVFVQHP